MLASFLRMSAAAVAILLCGCGESASSDMNMPVRGTQLGRGIVLQDGRKLFLRCAGTGSPTVLLESGFGADSNAWFAVAPSVSRVTRVCTYDRAGYGFSDPGPLPRDGAAMARDLDQALTRANEGGPFVLVGHSAGALYVRLLAARRLSNVRGLVLLDPTVERRAHRPGADDGLGGIRDQLTQCLVLSQGATQPPPGDKAWTGCLDPKNAQSVRLARNPQTWIAQMSELDSIFTRTSDQVLLLRGQLRHVPVYVITASETAAQSPTFNGESILELQHRMIARSADAGSQRTVVSSHLIMIQRPDVVSPAIVEMVEAAREGRPPAALAPSESLPQSQPSELRRLLDPFDPFKIEAPQSP